MERTVEYIFGRLGSHEKAINSIINSQQNTNRYNGSMNTRLIMLGVVVVVDQIKMAKLNENVNRLRTELEEIKNSKEV